MTQINYSKNFFKTYPNSVNGIQFVLPKEVATFGFFTDDYQSECLKQYDRKLVGNLQKFFWPFDESIPAPQLPLPLPLASAFKPLIIPDQRYKPQASKYFEININKAPQSASIIVKPISEDISKLDNNKCASKKEKMIVNIYKNSGSGKAYKARNVYKYIVRHLFLYINKNKDDIIRILKNANFTIKEIHEGFEKIKYYFELEKNPKLKINPQKIIKEMITNPSISTYILRETVQTLIKNWDTNKIGKISKSNNEIYKETCMLCYDQTVILLRQGSQAETFCM